MRTTTLALLLLGGCGGGNNAPDMSGADMTMRDLAMPDMARKTMTFHYVTNTIKLPTKASDYAADLNGDGKQDNALGFIVSTLKAVQMIDLAAQEDASVMNGDGLELFSLVSGDPMLVSDTAAEVTLYPAQSVNPPDFGGKGLFNIDKTVPKGTLTGPLVTGAFQSADPLTLTDPPTVELKIPIYTNTTVTLPVVGARIAFTPSATDLAAGQLNGAVKESDIQGLLIPALAQTFNAIAMRMPCDQNCMQVRMTFDKGNCTNPDNTMATANDGKIDLCEVSGSPLINALLSPDVQLYDDMGNWKPNASNGNKDSLSVGVAFTGVGAVFSE